MKRILTMLLTCIYVLALGVSLVGCGAVAADRAESRRALGIVVGNTACSQGLNLSSPLVHDTILNTITGYGRISVVNADGNPSLVADQDFDIPENRKAASAERLKMDAEAKASGFLTGLSGVIADHEEVDYLKSLQLCGRNLSSLEGYDSKEIIVVGTGLSTTGVLNFRNNLLSADPEAVADALEAQGEIPDLRGIRVYWQQLGDTAAPQAALNGLQRQTLREIWEAVIRRGGGEVVFDDMVFRPVSAQLSYPMVSVVDLPEAPVIAFDTEQPMPFDTPVSLPESDIRFIEDSDQYVDPAAVKEKLTPIARLLIANPDVTVMLCGCIAGDDATEGGIQLSLLRAEAVKRTLMELSVPEEQMVVKGLGTDNPWHIRNVGYTGDLAAQNRKVVLVNTESELGQALMRR